MSFDDNRQEDSRDLTPPQGMIAYWFLHHRPAFSVGLLLVVMALAVPQVRGLFPSWSEGFSSPWTRAGLFAFVAFTILSHWFAFLYVIQPDPAVAAPATDQPALTGPERLKRIRDAAAALTGEMLHLKKKRSCLFLILAALMFGSLWLPEGPETPSFMEIPVRWSVMFFCLLWSAYFGLPDWEMRRFAWRMLVVFSAFAVFGEVLWFVGLRSNLTSPRIYSIGAICFLINLVTSWVAFFDRWQALRPTWPIRLLAVTGLVAGVALMALCSGPPTVGTLPESALTTAAVPADGAGDKATEQWLSVLDARLKSLNARSDDGLEQPVIVVAASGGGSRAALFAALVYQYLDRLEGSRPPILMVSSVSGGSLASAVYTDEKFDEGLRNRIRIRDELRDGAPRNFAQRPIARLIAQELKALRSNKDANRIKTQTEADRERLDREIATLDQLANECERFSNSSDSDLPASLWFLADQFVDDMCTDFMAPLLRGTVHPGRERGESVTHFWNSTLGTTGDPGLNSRIPWLCNATEVGSGRPFPIGSTPAPVSLFSPPHDHALNIPFDVRQWRLSRWEAVRLSANFPWGFQVPNTSFHVTTSESMNRHVHLIDGGVFDNTGITTIRSLFDSIHARSAADIETTQPAAQEGIRTALSIMQQLRRRGVILLEIDSGAKPSPPGFVSRCFSDLLEPLGALSNSTYHTSERAIRDNLTAMQQTMRDPELARLKLRLQRLLLTSPQIPADETREQIERELLTVDFFSFKHVKLTCNEQENVMTAWALPPAEKAKVFSRFLNETAVLEQGFESRLAASSQQLMENQRMLTTGHEYVTNLEDAGDPDQNSIVKGIDLLCQTARSSELVDLSQQRLAAWELLYREKAQQEQFQKTNAHFDVQLSRVENWGKNSAQAANLPVIPMSPVVPDKSVMTEIVVHSDAPGSEIPVTSDPVTDLTANAAQKSPVPERPQSVDYGLLSKELKSRRDGLMQSGKFKRPIK